MNDLFEAPDPLDLLSSIDIRKVLIDTKDITTLELLDEAVDIISPNEHHKGECEYSIAFALKRILAAGREVRPTPAKLKVQLDTVRERSEALIYGISLLPDFERYQINDEYYCRTNNGKHLKFEDLVRDFRNLIDQMADQIEISAPARSKHAVAILAADSAYDLYENWNCDRRAPTSTVTGPYFALAEVMARAAGLEKAPSVVAACRNVIHERRPPET